MNTTLRTPLISEEEYQEDLRRALGEELAEICNLPYEERIQAIDDYQRNFDTPKDLVWPAEGYTGPDLP
jgi:hypothetical protein